MRRRRVWRRALLLSYLALAACGGKQGTLDVQIVTPANEDPFSDAARLRVRLGDPPIAEQIVALQGGQFGKLTLDFKPAKGMATVAPVIIEALDAGGRVTARGISPPLAILPVDEVVTVWVGRVGRFGVSRAALAPARQGAAVAAVPRLGLFVAGGDTADGAASAAIDIYSVYGHVAGNGQTTQRVAALPAPREGAVALGFERANESSGGVLVVGGRARAGEAPLPDVLLFDARAIGPTLYGMVSVVRNDDSAARSYPTVTGLPDGTWLLSGGLDQAGAPLRSAARVAVTPDVAATAVEAKMDAPRVGHTATPIQVDGQSGVLLFGGAPLPEVFLPGRGSFTARDLKLAPRSGHTATALADGRVLIAGGALAGKPPLADGVVIAASSLATTPLPALLSTPRRGHAAVVAGGELLLCGGVDATGTALASCDVLDGATLARTRTVPLGAARTGATLTVIDGGYVALSGGTSGEGPAATPVASIEIYRP